MEFFELITKRYSVRSYRSDPLEDKILHQILEAARIAPSAANRQPLQVIVIHTAGREAEIKRIYGREWFLKAPLLIAVCGILGEAWIRPSDQKCYVDVDAAILMDHLTLAAADLGLGTCWTAAFDPLAAREGLGLPEGVEPIVFTPLGYPADAEPWPKRRKEMAELVRYEHW